MKHFLTLDGRAAPLPRTHAAASPWRLGRALPLAALLQLAILLPASAQTEILIASGDQVPGIGQVTDVLEVTLNDAGDWAATVRADGLDPAGTAIVLNGAVFLQAGDPLPGLPGTQSFGVARNLELDETGALYWKHAAGPTGIFRNLEPIVISGETLNVAGLPAAATAKDIAAYTPFGGGALVSVRITGSGVTGGPLARVVLRYTLQPGGGFAGTLEAQTGQPYGLEGENMGFLFHLEDSLAVDGLGRIAFSAGSTAPGSQDAVWRDGVRIATAGAPSSVFGVEYKFLNPNSLSANAAGDLAYTAFLGPIGTSSGSTTKSLLWNGLEVARVGNSLPSISPGVLTSISNRFSLADDGGLLWYGKWQVPGGQERVGLFLDQNLLFEEGVSGLLGLTLDTWTTPGDSIKQLPSFELDASGTNVILRSALSDGRVAAVRVEIGPTPVEQIPGCTQAPLTLCVNSSIGGLCKSADFGPTVGLGNLITLSIRANDGLSLIGSAAGMGQVYFSADAVVGCGQPLAGAGEILVDLSPGQFLFARSLTNFGTFAFAAQLLPSEPTLVGLRFFAQAAWAEPAGSSFPPLRLTDALGFTIGL
jgi:hypothetical protein